VRSGSGTHLVPREKLDHTSIAPALLAAIELFLFGAAIPAEQFRTTCGEDTFKAFAALDLIRAAKHRDGAIVCPLWLYPVDGFVVASDRHDDPDRGSGRPSRRDRPQPPKSPGYGKNG
jgi:hypothetical protein